MKTETYKKTGLVEAYAFAEELHSINKKVWKIEVARNDDGTAQVTVISQRVDFDA